MIDQEYADSNERYGDVMAEQCGCTPRLDPIPFDADGDGIGEECRRCGEYIALVPVS